MKGKIFTRSKYYLLLVWLMFFLTSCIYYAKVPRIKNVFVSKQISSYKIESIAVLPIIPDDSSKIGAYFSTNYLYNIIYDDYPAIDIANLDWIREFDNSIVDEEIQNLKTIKRFDLNAFENSNLGRNIISEKYDAILIGNIDSVKFSEGMVFGTDGILRAWITSCSFRYFLISITDGKVLWAASCQSESYNYISNYFLKEYPSVEQAISIGIDEMVKIFPKEIFFEVEEKGDE